MGKSARHPRKDIREKITKAYALMVAGGEPNQVEEAKTEGHAQAEQRREL